MLSFLPVQLFSLRLIICLHLALINTVVCVLRRVKKIANCEKKQFQTTKYHETRRNTIQEKTEGEKHNLIAIVFMYNL